MNFERCFGVEVLRDYIRKVGFKPYLTDIMDCIVGNFFWSCLFYESLPFNNFFSYCLIVSQQTTDVHTFGQIVGVDGVGV